MANGGHVSWLLALYIMSLVLFALQVTLSSLAGSGRSDLFENTVGNVSRRFYLEITPASWTFSIWGFIYAWQAIWLVYALTLIFRRSSLGYLYVNPGVLSAGHLLAFNVACAFVIVWIFVWDRLMIEAAFVFLVLTCVALHTSLMFAHRQLDRITPILNGQGMRLEIWLVRLFVLNGLAFFTTWVTIASCLNFAHVMAYSGSAPLPQSASSTAALAVLMAVIFVWFGLKTFVFERSLRYTFSPLIVLLVGLVGSISNNWDRNKGNSIFTAILLTAVCVFGTTSLLLTFVRHRHDRLSTFRLRDSGSEVPLPKKPMTETTTSVNISN